MKENINLASKLFAKRILITVMSLLIVISVIVVCTFIFSTDIGYTVYGEKDGSERVPLYTYHYSEGEDTKWEEYEQNGYELIRSNIRELSQQGNNIFLIISQVLNILILAVIVYPVMWKQGFSDRNMSNLGHIKADKLRGFKIGLMSSVPAIIILLVMLSFTLGINEGLDISLYKFINGTFYSLSKVIIGSAETAGELGIINYLWLALLQLAVPVAAEIGYIFGFNEISIKEKLVYKKEA